MTSAPNDIAGYRDALEAFLVGRDEPAWFAARRRAALDAFEARGLPTRKDEDWKYTPIGRFGRTVFEPAGELRADAGLVAAAKLDNAAATLVFVAGRYAPDLSSVAELGHAVRVRRLAECLDEGDVQRLASVDGLGGFDALRAAFTTDGAVIELAPETELGGILHIVHLGPAGRTPWLSATSNFVRLGGHARATLVESFVGATGADYLACTSTRVRIGDGAQLDHVRIQAHALSAAHIASDDVVVSRDGTYRSFNFSIGAELARDTLEVRVEGAGAHTDLAALYVPGRGQSIDNHTTIDHRARSCTANQLYKGILDADGHGVFNGRIFVRKAAQQTSAVQLNQNLMLSREARIDTKPQLEIFADDVRCTHGATVGQIEPEELFYMMSRAIPERDARRMLVRGFADGALERVEDPGAREKMAALLDARLLG